jgi:hypothetical protein
VITPITSVMLSYFLLTILNFGGGR